MEPERTGERAITGPYVDYLCTDQYTLTFTAPLTDAVRELGSGRQPLPEWHVTGCPGTPFVVARQLP